MRIDSAIITGSFSVNGDTFNDLGVFPSTGSNTFIGNQNIVGAVSASALTGSINYTNLTGVPTLISGSEQIVGILSPLNSYTQSSTLRLNSLEQKTGSLATTGSNTFIGNQTISGTVYIQDNLIVQGSSSLQNITASAVSIGTNIVNLNTANPSIRFAGLSIVDSGSVGGSGSFLYDSLQDEMIFVHRGASSVVTSSVTLMGPETYDNVGSETYLTSNRIPKGTGNEHLGDSNISDDGTTVVFDSRNIYVDSSRKIGRFGGAAESYLIPYDGNDGSFRIYANHPTGGLLLYTNNTLKATLNASGNLGLGVTPSAWNGIYKVVEIGTAAIFGTTSYNSAAFSTNVFYNSGNSPRYIANDFSNMYWQDDGNHVWYNAPSGTAGNAISFTQAMTLNASGNLSVGNTNDSFKLDVSGTGRFKRTNGDARVIIEQTNTSAPYTATLELSSQGIGTYGGTIQYDAGPENLTIENYGRSASGLSRGDVKFRTKVDNTTPTDVLTLNGFTGQATFSSKVAIGNTTAYGGLTVSDFTANDGNDTISLFYRGTSGGHQSLMKFYDFRGQLNASMGNDLQDDGTGTPRARIVFKTSNGGSPIERMKIDASGIITTPSQVSFKAYISANASYSKSTNITIPYNIEEYDTQGNYSTSTYKFTAPVAGKYLFTVNFNAYQLDDTAYLRIMLIINSASVRTLFLFPNMPTGNTGDVNVSGSDILNLAVGNTVEVRVYTDGSGTFGMSQNLDWNSFSGHLLG